MPNQSIINTMEVLETKSISDLTTEVTIKVCYVSDEKNRNNTIITKEVGKQIAATLPGAPVVGFFDTGTQDFEEHSRQVTFKNGEMEIEDITIPYGFVSLDNPWYQDFEEDGEIRTYLMCKAYLWTRQYEEANKALNKGQSMELDQRTMSGYYEGDVFVFTSATLDKLCILGDNYEPCFEGANIVSNYSLGYNALSEEVAKNTGRNFNLMSKKTQNSTEKKPVTLSYALELGWQLVATVANQLYNQGMIGYSVVGVYEENGQKFVIIQNEETNEYSKLGIVIYDDETIALDENFEMVQLVWAPQIKDEKEKTKPIEGQPPVEVASTANLESGDFALEEKGQTMEKEKVEVKVEVKEEQPTTEFTEEAVEEAVEAQANITEVQVEESVSEEVSQEVEAVVEAEEVVAEESTVDLTAEFTAKIEALEAELAEYKLKEKEILYATFESMLSAEDLEEVKAATKEFSYSDTESALAVKYARSQQNKKPNTQKNSQYQLDIANIKEDNSDVPDFMKQAIEYDKAHSLGLSL